MLSFFFEKQFKHLLGWLDISMEKRIRRLKAKARSVFQRRLWFFRDPLWLKKAIAQQSHFELVIEKVGKDFLGARG